jgi:GrpB-like predicted nucleotidyltransferase (UPF0157 family)
MEAPAVVVPYNPQWPALFEAVRARVDEALAPVPHRTVHVGSTAVPGLDAKPIIDLDAVLPSPQWVNTAVAALGRAGWRHEGDLGIAGREAFASLPGLPYHHLYLVVAGSAAYADHIDMRDFLRSHPGHAARYAQRKHALAGLLQTDRDAYSAGKADLVAQFLLQARLQASAKGG